ncbi:uncharacterized protein LOC125647771 [Ostrea edulis]|uniref:uncharacterized protein LOC125647771 n=1 Tax=Ostrea edulis TaxID=37623 RepID=UPI0024AF7D83|nr:uncharacterized protein LOC125647771 [Ostrea edulis]
MDYRLGILLVASAFITAAADSKGCAILNEKSRMYCYQARVYTACKTSCSEKLLLKDEGGKSYKDNLCPWGNYANVYNTAFDSYCQQKIAGNCPKYCTNPSQSDITWGRQCCKACVDMCAKAPSRDNTFQKEYPGVY